MKKETKNTAMGVISIILTILFGLASLFGVTVAPSVIDFGDPRITGFGMFLMVVFGGCLGWIARNWRAKKLLGMSIEDAAAQLKEYEDLKKKDLEGTIESLHNEKQNLACEYGRLEGQIEVLRDGGYVSKREIERRSEEHSEEVLKEIAEGKY